MTKKPRYPSFAGLQPSSPSSSSTKRANRSRSTKAEVCLQHALKGFGLRFRANDRRVLGVPDVVIPALRIAVFCDGDFWHGRRWSQLRELLLRRANAPYWTAKIAANRRRDRLVNRSLRQDGWCVVRYWETDIRANPSKIAADLAAKVQLRAQARSVATAKHGRRSQSGAAEANSPPAARISSRRRAVT